MPSFSERYGYTPVNDIIQQESLNDETRMSLWNLVVRLRGLIDEQYSRVEPPLMVALWAEYFKLPLDEAPNYPYYNSVWDRLKGVLLRGSWYEVLDLLEFLVKEWSDPHAYGLDQLREAFVSAINGTFEQKLVSYRIIGDEITPIDSEIEVEAIEDAQEKVSKLDGARHALDQALELLSDRNMPDYPNSIKESISAVESVVRLLTNKTTLSAGLKKLEDNGLVIHRALKDAWVKMYGWASDDHGIRHGGIEPADANQALAKYTLVVSSAFVSYLVDEGRTVGLFDTD